MIDLSPGETIIAAWAETTSGPGWVNRPVWVLVQSATGYRVECIQPEDQTDAMHVLFRVSEAVNLAMVRAVERALAVRGEKGGEP